jgi:hypothetical protein
MSTSGALQLVTWRTTCRSSHCHEQKTLLPLRAQSARKSAVALDNLSEFQTLPDGTNAEWKAVGDAAGMKGVYGREAGMGSCGCLGSS